MGWDDTVRGLRGNAESGLVAVVYIVVSNLANLKAEWTVALFRHYVGASGASFEIDPVPQDWQEWIIGRVGRRPGRRVLKPYNSGIFDLRNGLGHFENTVTVGGGSTVYQLNDRYVFGDVYTARDRHGFPVDALSPSQRSTLKRLLPDKVYKGRRTGFEERFELKKVGREHILYIPQPVLEDHGVPFLVTGRFRTTP